MSIKCSQRLQAIVMRENNYRVKVIYIGCSYTVDSSNQFEVSYFRSDTDEGMHAPSLGIAGVDLEFQRVWFTPS